MRENRSDSQLLPIAFVTSRILLWVMLGLALFGSLSSSAFTNQKIAQELLEVDFDDDAPYLLLVDKRADAQDTVFVNMDEGIDEKSKYGTALLFIPYFSAEEGLSYDTVQRTPIAGDVYATCMKYSGLLSNDALFYSEYCVPDEEVKIPFGSQNLTVPKGAVKISIGIDSWPFGAVTNTLQFDIKFNLKADESLIPGYTDVLLQPSDNFNSTTPTATLPPTKYERLFRLSLAHTNATVRFPLYSILDQREVAVTTTQASLANNIVRFSFQFPHFIDSLSYELVLYFDGAIVPSPAETSAATSVFSLAPINLLLLLLIAIPLIFCFGVQF